MYEILNSDMHDDSVIAYFRNVYNRSIVAIAKTSQHTHLEFTANETSKHVTFILYNKSFSF